MSTRRVAMWFTAALGAGCIDGEFTGRSSSGDPGTEVADEAVAQEAARMERASGGWLGLGRAIAAVDGPAGEAAVALDPEQVRHKLGFDAAYAQRVRASFALQTPAPSQNIVIGIDNRIIVNTPRQYPYNKHVYTSTAAQSSPRTASSCWRGGCRRAGPATSRPRSSPTSR